ncbi:MAG: hypothetical protein M1821_004624 [Bathelium mastoideum]|nr:MAG: hypothetical protein M1821_004624 [Bathelium mastoideum]
MSGPSADSSSTFLELGWTSSHISVGTGYDFAGRQLRPSALQDVGAPTETKEGRDIQSNVHVVSTDQELKTRIKFDFKANIPLEGASVTTENSYLSSLETSDTSLTQVIQQSVVDQPARLDIHQLKLTDEARAVLEGPDGWRGFSQRYGEYFIYGFRSRARFSAICSIKTSSKTSRNEIKTSLEVGVEKAGSLNATLESLKQQKTESVKIDVNVEISGLNNVGNEIQLNGAKPEGDAKAVKTNKLEEVQKMYDNFQMNFKTQPYLGLLCHYSALDTTGKIPLPANQFAHLGPALEGMYKSLFTAHIDLVTSPMVQAAATSKEIVALCEEITKLNLADITAITAIDSKVRVCLNNVDLWRLRSDLLGDIGKLKNDKMDPGDWIEAFNQREWASGVLGVDNDKKYGVLIEEVSHKNESYRGHSWFAHSNSRNFVMGDHDKIIIGYKITSWWNDGTNGWYKLYHGNVLESEINIEISSYKSRGCHWDIDVWMVPKTIYEEKR